MTGFEAAEAAEKNELYARRHQEREARVAQRAGEKRAEYQQEAEDNGWEVGGGRWEMMGKWLRSEEEQEIGLLCPRTRTWSLVLRLSLSEDEPRTKSLDESEDGSVALGERGDRLLKQLKLLLKAKERKGKGEEKTKER